MAESSIHYIIISVISVFLLGYFFQQQHAEKNVSKIYSNELFQNYQSQHPQYTTFKDATTFALGLSSLKDFQILTLFFVSMLVIISMVFYFYNKLEQKWIVLDQAQKTQIELKKAEDAYNHELRIINNEQLKRERFLNDATKVDLEKTKDCLHQVQLQNAVAQENYNNNISILFNQIAKNEHNIDQLKYHHYELSNHFQKSQANNSILFENQKRINDVIYSNIGQLKIQQNADRNFVKQLAFSQEIINNQLHDQIGGTQNQLNELGNNFNVFANAQLGFNYAISGQIDSLHNHVSHLDNRMHAVENNSLTKLGNVVDDVFRFGKKILFSKQKNLAITKPTLTLPKVLPSFQLLPNRQLNKKPLCTKNFSKN